MYDVYGDVVVLTERSNCQLRDVLAIGYKKIYRRTAYKSQYRVLDLEWVSPYVEKSFSSKYIHTEDGHHYYGDLKQVYFSARYATQRRQLKKYFSQKDLKSLIVVGAGIGPFTVVLSPFFECISQYETNPLCERYNRINMYYNKCPAQYFSIPYKGEIADALVSVIPKGSLQFQLSFNFRSICVLYFLADDSECQNVADVFRTHYGCKVDHKVVRAYSKGCNIYRYTLSRQSPNK